MCFFPFFALRQSRIALITSATKKKCCLRKNKFTGFLIFQEPAFLLSRQFPVPFAVFLNTNDKPYVEPDISIICDKSKLDDRGYNGAPDWIIEIASSGTKRIDYGVKLFKYHSAGVREYWIVNPLTRTVNVYDLEKEELTDLYSFDDDIQVCIYDDLTINITELLKQQNTRSANILLL